MSEMTVIRMKQNGRTMFVGVMPVGELLSITDVDWFDPEIDRDDPAYLKKQGYQRNPTKSRVNKFASYLGREESLVPTSILLAARTNLSFTPKNGDHGTLELPNEPLWVIDGQHRLRGFEAAITEKGQTDLEDFPVAICVIEGLSKLEEMMQFYTVNKTAKSVRTDLADELINLYAKQSQEAREELIDAKLLSRGSVWRLDAVDITNAMNEYSGSSVWTGMIKQANAPRGDTIISARSFSTSLKAIINDQSGLGALQQDDLVEWLTAYWNTIAELMPEPFEEPRDYVIQKTLGTGALHEVAPRVFALWWDGGRSKKALRDILTANAELDLFFAEPEHWKSSTGDFAQYGGRGGQLKLAQQILDALPMIKIKFS